jgi:enoyl-CoA hydratase/carnithine racemase
VYEDIRYEVIDPVATITLHRPDRLNAFTNRMGVELRDAVGRAERDPAVVGIVLTGAGRGFCAGADLGMLDAVAGGDRSVTSDADGANAVRADAVVGDPSWGADLRGTYTYLLSVPKPIVAAINGPIAGMGVPIALACDLRFMADDAVLTMAFSQRGLIAEWGVAWLLPRLVGSGAALDLLFSSRKVTGTECAAMGLVNRSLPTAEVLAHAVAYVQELARTVSPASMAVMKRQVHQQLHAGLGPAEQEAVALMLESFGRPDFAEGVRSYQERRDPQFPRIGEAPEAS